MRAETMTSETYPLSIGGDIIATEDQLLEKVERGITMSGSAVKYLIVHCSATREDRSYTVEQLRRDHLARGFIDIGYHYYIRKDGTVTRHRRLTEVGAHCRPYNRCSIGVCYEGGLAPDGSPKDTRTPMQRRVLSKLLTDLKRLFPQALIRGHCEMPGAVPKACPCYKPSREYRFIK